MSVAAVNVEADSAGSHTAESDGLDGLDERVEFAIACYADGTLEPERRGEIESLLATDARARALRDEYENLDATAKAVAYNDPFGAVNWDQLARQLSDTVHAVSGTLSEAFERQVAEYSQGDLSAAKPPGWKPDSSRTSPPGSPFPSTATWTRRCGRCRFRYRCLR